MPQYYFDIIDTLGSHRDEFGDDCQSLEDARRQCRVVLPEIAREQFQNGDLHRIVCEVRDENGEVVYCGELTYQGTRNPSKATEGG